jgi:hypothetical protein
VAETIPNPILVFDHVDVDAIDGLGGHFDRYNFRVTNFASFPAELFAATSAFGACGGNTTPSRTWVTFFRSDNDAPLETFCALGSPSDLNGIWFPVFPTGGTPPAAVYIKLMDRSTTPSTDYTSNSVAVP